VNRLRVGLLYLLVNRFSGWDALKGKRKLSDG